MAEGDTARLYHRLTSYGPETDWPATPIEHPLVLQDFVTNDFERWPPAYKAYPDALPVVELPREWPAVAAPATAVLAGHGAPAQAAAPDLPALARLLYLSAGVRAARRAAV